MGVPFLESAPRMRRRFYFDPMPHQSLNLKARRTVMTFTSLPWNGIWPGSPDETTVFPQLVYVDYVRVYQHPK